MKLKTTVYRSISAEVENEITKVVHNIPSWIFEESYSGQKETKCPVCNREIRKQISHGTFIEDCSVMQLNGYKPMVIHTDCYNKLKAADENATE